MIVVSDMMGTLTRGSPMLGLVDWIRHHQGRLQAEWLVAYMLPGYFLGKMGWIDLQRWKQTTMVASLAWLDDVTPEKFDRVCEWTVEHNLWPKRRQDAIARLGEHVQNGAQVYIASSVFEPMARHFAHRFGAQAIGTPVQVENGRARLSGGLVSSERKIQEVLARLGVERVDYAYGDTYMDIPLLENAVHPVAVYPDRRLWDRAKECGWEIMGQMQ
jgi:phosphoserine phosphatase